MHNGSKLERYALFIPSEVTNNLHILRKKMEKIPALTVQEGFPQFHLDHRIQLSINPRRFYMDS